LSFPEEKGENFPLAHSRAVKFEIAKFPQQAKPDRPSIEAKERKLSKITLFAYWHRYSLFCSPQTRSLLSSAKVSNFFLPRASPCATSLTSSEEQILKSFAFLRREERGKVFEKIIPLVKGKQGKDGFFLSGTEKTFPRHQPEQSGGKKSSRLIVCVEFICLLKALVKLFSRQAKSLLFSRFKKTFGGG
jgi:hypothetical protein